MMRLTKKYLTFGVVKGRKILQPQPLLGDSIEPEYLKLDRYEGQIKGAS